jgi:MFS family permease
MPDYNETPSSLAARLSRLLNSYPRQFWLLFVGMLISTLGSSMIWPFLMIYATERLQQPLSVVTILMTINAAAGLVFSFIAGPVTDRFGRKWVMVVSLLVNGLAYLFMIRADSLFAFGILMGISGAFNPLYRVGADAMMADLVPAEKRIDAYSLMRTSNNLGIALGPVIGGIVISISYSIAFVSAAFGLITYGVLIAAFAKETLVKAAAVARTRVAKFGGYALIIKDRPFIAFTFVFTLTMMCAALIWVLLSVYAKDNYQVPESQYGFIANTNALMVVFFQLPVTQITKRYPPLLVLAGGSLFYAVGVGSVALGHGFWAFWLSMVILTVGELMLSPTATSYAANLAPADMRGRYMSIYGMTWGVALAIAPLMGGILNDRLGPPYIWLGGLAVGIASVFGFLLLARRYPQPAPAISSD